MGSKSKLTTTVLHLPLHPTSAFPPHVQEIKSVLFGKNVLEALELEYKPELRFSTKNRDYVNIEEGLWEKRGEMNGKILS